MEKKEGKKEGMMQIGLILGFLPWILFFLIAGNTQRQMEIAIIIVLLFTIVFNRKDLRKGFILPWGTVIFFTFGLLTVVMVKHSWIGSHLGLLSNCVLATISLGSLAIGKPFTIQYARQQVPKDKWDNPIFIRVNNILTSAWGLIFLFNIALHIMRIYYADVNRWFYEMVSDGSTIFGIWLCVWFPKWYVARLKAKKAESKT
jgi:carotenoid cleavage dioxygenase